MSYISNAAMDAAQAYAVNVGAGRGGGGGGGGGGIANGSLGSIPQANPYADSWDTVVSRTNVLIEQVENGYLVTIYNKHYICATAESACQQILVQMVAKKMENK